MIFNENISSFPVTIYGDLSKYNDVISKGRCRIFYKYDNRNGTYITDEFADKLLNTIAYAPIKGIYSEEEEDYEDHGLERDSGRIYGVVPKDYNLAWEEHLDEDGILRTYACVDVLLYTAIYEEASEIIGKSQSMELYDKSIVGKWEFINGKKFFVYEDACFLGLQVLGDSVEPCFEGAAFYNLYNSFSEFMKILEEKELHIEDKKQGGNLMFKINFKLSDNQKFEAIWSLLNPNFTEEGGYEVDYSIYEIYDNYAVVKNYKENIYERVEYVKDDASDSITLGKKRRCYILDVTEEEKIALEALQKINSGNYEKIDEKVAEAFSKNEEFEEKINSLEEEVVNFETKKEEFEKTISTLEIEKDKANANFESSKEAISQLEYELKELKENKEALESFKAGVELKNKQAILDSYSNILSAEILDKYSEKLSEFEEESLDKELAYELKKANPAFYTVSKPGYVPKDEPRDGLEELLMKYSKK